MSWTLRIMTWNVRGLRDDRRALIDAVRDTAPDILLLQEAPQVLLPGARLRWLASRMGLEVLQGGLLGRGLAILATPEVASQVLRVGLVPVPQRVSDANSVFPRGVAAVRLSIPGGGDLVVAVIHLALDEEHRLTHVRRLIELVEGAGAPVIVAGDMNENPRAAAWTELSAVVRDCGSEQELTFPAARPQHRIDAVMVTPDVEVISEQAISATSTVSPERLRGATDHRPVVAEVAVRSPVPRSTSSS